MQSWKSLLFNNTYISIQRESVSDFKVSAASFDGVEIS